MKALLSEYRGPYDTGENIGGFDFRTPEEKADQEELKRKKKEAAKKIVVDELQRIMDAQGIKGKTPEEFSNEIRKERGAIRRRAKDAAAAGARSAEDFQKAIESGQYQLTAGQQKMRDKHGTAYVERLSRGLSRREVERLRSSAKVTDQNYLS